MRLIGCQCWCRSAAQRVGRVYFHLKKWLMTSLQLFSNIPIFWYDLFFSYFLWNWSESKVFSHEEMLAARTDSSDQVWNGKTFTAKRLVGNIIPPKMQIDRHGYIHTAGQNRTFYTTFLTAVWLIFQTRPSPLSYRLLMLIRNWYSANVTLARASHGKQFNTRWCH